MEAVFRKKGPAAGPRDATPLILDAGCGTGGVLRKLGASRRLFGLDRSPLALERARRRGAFPLCRGSVTRLPYRSGSFDLILSLDVLYHRGVESDLEALREFRRCLRPGGFLILNLPAFESLRSSHDLAIHTGRRYRRGQLGRLLEEAGLAPVRITYWNTTLFPAIALFRWLRRGRAASPGRAPDPSDVAPVPLPFDRILGWVLDLERVWLRALDLPFGLSLFAVARREGPA